MQDEIVFRFPDEGTTASARLLREKAPETCCAVLDALPAAGPARHGIYSGSEVYLILPMLLAQPREHSTAIVGPGNDVRLPHGRERLGVRHRGGLFGSLLVLRPRRDALDARGADRRERLRPTL